MADLAPVSSASEPVVLLIEDDDSTRLVYGSVLRKAGYTVVEAGDGESGFAEVKKVKPGLILLDVEMPRQDGWTTLEQIRKAGYREPVLMLTGKAGLDDKVRGLGIGADDYLTKPCDARELLARVNAALRRARPPEPALPTLYFGDLAVDLVARTARRIGEPVKLTKTEFSVLDVLARHAGKTVTREKLLETVWGYGEELNTRTVETTIYRLRQKIGDRAGDPLWIKTIPTGGYALARETLSPVKGVLYDRRKG